MKENSSLDNKLELIHFLRNESQQNKAMVRSRENIIKGNRTTNIDDDDSVLFFRQMSASIVLRVAIALLLLCCYWYCSQNNIQVGGYSASVITSKILTDEQNMPTLRQSD